MRAPAETVARASEHVCAEFVTDVRLPQPRSGPAGAEVELGPAEGDRLPGEAAQVRDEGAHLVRCEGGLPALAEGRVPGAAAHVEAGLDRLRGDKPLVARILNRGAELDEAGAGERSRERVCIE